MKKKQTLLQKTKTWWHNLPHKWFLLLQLCLPLIACCSVVAAIFYGVFFLIILPALFIIQICFIKHYYGWKTFFLSLLIVPIFVFIIQLVFYLLPPDIFTYQFSPDPGTSCDDCLYGAPPVNLTKVVQTILVLIGFFIAPIIPQLWRSNHGRK